MSSLFVSGLWRKLEVSIRVWSLGPFFDMFSYLMGICCKIRAYNKEFMDSKKPDIVFVLIQAVKDIAGS